MPGGALGRRHNPMPPNNQAERTTIADWDTLRELISPDKRVMGFVGDNVPDGQRWAGQNVPPRPVQKAAGLSKLGMNTLATEGDQGHTFEEIADIVGADAEDT